MLYVWYVQYQYMVLRQGLAIKAKSCYVALASLKLTMYLSLASKCHILLLQPPEMLRLLSAAE